MEILILLYCIIWNTDSIFCRWTCWVCFTVPPQATRTWEACSRDSTSRPLGAQVRCWSLPNNLTQQPQWSSIMGSCQSWLGLLCYWNKASEVQTVSASVKTNQDPLRYSSKMPKVWQPPPYPNIVTSKSHRHGHVQRTLNWFQRYQIGTFTCHVFPAKTKVCPRYDLENPRNLKVPSRLLSKKLKSTYVHIQSSPNPESAIQFCFQSFLPNKSQFKF